MSCNSISVNTIRGVTYLGKTKTKELLKFPWFLFQMTYSIFDTIVQDWQKYWRVDVSVDIKRLKETLKIQEKKSQLTSDKKNVKSIFLIYWVGVTTNIHAHAIPNTFKIYIDKKITCQNKDLHNNLCIYTRFSLKTLPPSFISIDITNCSITKHALYKIHRENKQIYKKFRN